MNKARETNGEFRHPAPWESKSRGDVGDDHGYGEVYDLDAPVLSPDEQSALKTHETAIERGLKTFYEVGEALLAIRDGRLYRESHSTFEDYCTERWQLKRSYAYEIMAASEVVSNLSGIPDMPSNVAQVRPLTSLPPEQQAAAWQSAVETAPNGRVTAAHVQSVVDEIKTPPRNRISYGPSEDDYQDEVPSAQVDEGETWETAKLKPLANGRYSENESEWKLGGRGAPVKAASGQEGTLAFASGRIAFVDTKNGRRQYDVNNLTRLDGVVIQTSELTPPIAPNYKRDSKSTHAADEYTPQGQDACQTPAYAIDPLLPYLPTDWTIWEPAAGEGFLAEALFDSGFDSVETSDILTGQNFFEYAPPEFDAIVTNPPFTLKFKWLERCYELGRPFALLVPVEALGAKKAQDLMQKYGFEIMLLNRRVHFKMPVKGWEGSAQFPVCWLCWKLLPEQVMFGNIEYPDAVDEEE